eukprot:scaffold8029_cov71-Phaeocystis_antarctica.AAC.5
MPQTNPHTIQVTVRGSLPSAICQLPASAGHSWSPNKRVLRERTPYRLLRDSSTTLQMQRLASEEAPPKRLRPLATSPTIKPPKRLRPLLATSPTIKCPILDRAHHSPHLCPRVSSSTEGAAAGAAAGAAEGAAEGAGCE